MKVSKESRDIGLLFFFNLCARRGGWLTPRPGSFTAKNEPVPFVFVVRNEVLLKNSNLYAKAPCVVN